MSLLERIGGLFRGRKEEAAPPQPASEPGPVPIRSVGFGSVAFRCPCGKALKVRPELVGKRVGCSGCHRILTVPPPLKD